MLQEFQTLSRTLRGVLEFCLPEFLFLIMFTLELLSKKKKGKKLTADALQDGLGGKPPPSWEVDQQSGFAVLLVYPRQLFYHDLPVEEGEYWVTRLTKQSSKALMEGGEAVYSGWKDVPVWYLATSQDQALPVEAQRFFVQSAKEAGGDITLREVESSHSPMLSKPKETADFLLEAVKAFDG